MTQIRQGEELSVSGLLKDDSGVVITDYTTRKLSVILMDSKQEVVDSWSNKEGANNMLVITPEGVLQFNVADEDTRNMLGDYFFEFKVTDGESLIGKQMVKVQVLNSKIGREMAL